ncbi:heat shock 70 kDa protein, putative, partial [Trypanosoma cruzi]
MALVLLRAPRLPLPFLLLLPPVCVSLYCRLPFLLSPPLLRPVPRSTPESIKVESYFKKTAGKKKKMTYEGAIGIDLGTTYSCVGVWQNERVEIIANDQGNRTTPSYVAFTDTERLIGDAAKNQVAMNPTNTVFDAKRLIGRKFSDPVVQSDMKHWPFKVITKGDDKPVIQVQFRGETKTFNPEEVSSMVLSKMKE